MHYKNFPNGTHIVTLVDKPYKEGLVKRGSVGVVHERLSEDSYQVKLPDGRELSFLATEMRPQRDSFRAEHVSTELTYEQIKPLIVFEFIRGSVAYGLNTPESDEDTTGAFVLPTRMFFGIKKYQDTVHKNPDKSDTEYHEIEKLIKLAAKGNPGIIEIGSLAKIPELVKISPHDEIICELLDQWNDIFVSKYVFRAYQGYALSQFKKIEHDLRSNNKIRWKHACHLIRLLWCGTEAMKTGEIVVRPKDHSILIHNRLMEIRSGNCSEEQFWKYKIELEKDFQESFERCGLKECADLDKAEKFLVAIREKFLL